METEITTETIIKSAIADLQQRRLIPEWIFIGSYNYVFRSGIGLEGLARGEYLTINWYDPEQNLNPVNSVFILVEGKFEKI